MAAVTFGGKMGFLYPILLTWCMVFHSTFDPWTQHGWDKQTLITHILPFFGICSNSYIRIVDRCPPSYSWMTLQDMEWIWYYISRNLTRTISSLQVSTTWNITHKLCVFVLSTWFNMRPMSEAATILDLYWAPCLNIIVVLGNYTPVKDHYWSNHSYQFSIDHCMGIHLVRKFTYLLY